MDVSKAKAFLKLIRIDYSGFSSFGVLVSGILARDLTGLQSEYLIAILIVFLTAGGSFAFNDYYDYKIDKVNKRLDRPLVLEQLSKKTALITSIIFYLIVIMLSLFTNSFITISILISLPFFILYSIGLKKITFLKNIIIAYAFVATIFLGSLVSDMKLEPLIIYFAIMGFIVGMAFEIMLDIGDRIGDKEQEIETVVIRFGLKSATYLSVILYGIIIILDPLPFFLNIDSQLYFDYIFLILIIIPVISYILVSNSLLKDQSPNTIIKLKNQVFLTMQIGSIAYVIGVLI